MTKHTERPASAPAAVSAVWSRRPGRGHLRSARLWLAAGAALVALLGWREYAARPAALPPSPGRLCRSDALKRATDLCGRLADVRCEAGEEDAVGYAKRLPDGSLPRREWLVECAAAAVGRRYFVRLDADTGEMISFNQWGIAGAAPEAPAGINGDVGRLSERETDYYVRRYLARAGVKLPGDVRPIRASRYDRRFRVGGREPRRVSIGIDPRDARLVYLLNLPVQRFPDGQAAPDRRTLADAAAESTLP
jgi:hypothetical protein